MKGLTNFLKIKSPGYFIFIDTLIALCISSLCLMLIFKEFHRITLYRRYTEQLISERNRVTEILTSKHHYVQEKDLKEDRVYEIFHDVYVEIYHIEFENHIQERYGLEKIEFGLVKERKGE